LILLTLLTALLLAFFGCKKENDEIIDNPVNNLPDISGYPIVNTNQSTFYDNSVEISVPASGEAFFGQDAQYV